MNIVVKIKTCALLLLVCSPQLSGQNRNKSTVSVRNATVKIFNTYIRPDFCSPWKMSNPQSATGSGAILKNNLVLTNAHVVSDSTFLQVQKENDPTLYNAEVVFIGHTCDLALLKVKDKSFFKNTSHLSFGSIPELRSKVTTYGYPMGGERISITEGIVSRIEMGNYYHSGESAFLMIQTDAAINPGNSGGPVVQDGKIVGVAFQVRRNSSNIGYMIPVPVINHFLKDFSNNKIFDGFPSLGIFTSNLQNQDYRDYLGLVPTQSGILVTHVIPGSSADTYLKKNDVILQINNIPIANDGSIPFGDGRIRFGHKIDMLQVGEKVKLHIFRNKNKFVINIPLKTFPYRIPWNNSFEFSPRYIIWGGVIFQPLSKDYLKCWDKWWFNANRRMLYYYMYHLTDNITPHRNEFVIINHVLPDKANTYISDTRDQVVKTINGRAINKLEDVLDAFKKPVNGYHVINVEGTNMPIILPANDLRKANKRIQKKYDIPALIQLRKNKRYRD